LKARIERLDTLQDGLIAEAAKWKDAESPLPPGEREQHLNAGRDAIIGLFDAREALEAACHRAPPGA
jgi:hypothetical protein